MVHSAILPPPRGRPFFVFFITRKSAWRICISYQQYGFSMMLYGIRYIRTVLYDTVSFLPQSFRAFCCLRAPRCSIHYVQPTSAGTYIVFLAKRALHRIPHHRCSRGIYGQTLNDIASCHAHTHTATTHSTWVAAAFLFCCSTAGASMGCILIC